MRQIPMAVLASLVTPVALVAFTHGRSAVAEKADAKPENKQAGTWKQVSGKFNGKEFRPPIGTTVIKHVTPTQFMFVDYDEDGKVTDAFGGPYTLKGDKYEETPCTESATSMASREDAVVYVEGGGQQVAPQRHADQRSGHRGGVGAGGEGGEGVAPARLRSFAACLQ